MCRVAQTEGIHTACDKGLEGLSASRLGLIRAVPRLDLVTYNSVRRDVM